MKMDEMFQGNNALKPAAHPRRDTKWIHYTKLIDNENQYRTGRSMDDILALADLIEADGGVIQNILVRKTDTDAYEIIAGHHRRRACQYLVEECGKPEFEFLPCTVENINDVRAEFQLYSSNGHLPKTEYEIMHELERMKYLLETYPEEFPDLQKGRMVERLAKKMNMKRSTVGEYLAISKNLTDTAKEAFKEGTLKKSAAVEMSSLSDDEQERLINENVTDLKRIREYKGKTAAPKPDEILPEPVRKTDPENVPDFGTNEVTDETENGDRSTTGLSADPEVTEAAEDTDVPKSGTQEPVIEKKAKYHISNLNIEFPLQLTPEEAEQRLYAIFFAAGITMESWTLKMK